MRCGFVVGTLSMEYEWDESKPRINKTKHGVDFSSIADFDWTTAFVMEDQRRDYGEILNIALGFIRSRLHALVFTKRNEKIRPQGMGHPALRLRDSSR